MKCFFFGTLMSPYVIARITNLDISYVKKHLSFASIRGFKRVYAEGAHFPVLVPTNNPNNLVDGCLFEYDDEDSDIILRRLDAYESALYYRELHSVYTNERQEIAYVYFYDSRRLTPAMKEWKFEN